MPFRDMRVYGVFAIKMLCGLVMLISGIFTLYTVGPSIETRFFPVVSKLTITSLRGDEQGHTVIGAEFTKRRNCEYLGISWFVGDRKADFERVPVILLRKPGDTSSPNRPQGKQKAGPWIIGASPEDVKMKSFAQLSHRCHALWVSTTEFYP